MGNNVQELIEMLSNMIKEARSVPLSSEKCMVERDKVLDLIDSIKDQLPTEMAEAKRLVEARAEFIANAKREAETVRHAAEERAKQMVNEQEIYRTAQAKSEKMLASAEHNSAALRKAASDYAEDMLRRTEESIAKALDEIRESRAGFHNALNGDKNVPARQKEEIPDEEPEADSDFED